MKEKISQKKREDQRMKCHESQILDSILQGLQLETLSNRRTVTCCRSYQELPPQQRDESGHF